MSLLISNIKREKGVYTFTFILTGSGSFTHFISLELYSKKKIEMQYFWHLVFEKYSKKSSL